MKRIITKQFNLLLSAALLLLAVGCGQNENSTDNAKTDSTAHQPVVNTDSLSGKPPKNSMLDSIVAEGLTKNIPLPVGYANDFEGIFTKAQIRSLDSLSRAIEKESTIEIVIVTLDSTMTNRKDFSKTVLALANKWKVGKKGKNNGIVVGISKQLRTIWIRNGFGIEKKVSNQQTTEIIQTAFLPQFKQNKFYEGTKQGIIALYQQSK